MKVEPFLIASTLNIIIAQRLVRVLCEEKEKYYLKDSEIKKINRHCDTNQIIKVFRQEKLLKQGQSLKDVIFYRAKPNQKCQDGYKGRIGARNYFN